MGFLKTIGAVWLARRFPVLAAATIAIGTYKRHRDRRRNMR
jgi:hypothetical protein